MKKIIIAGLILLLAIVLLPPIVHHFSPPERRVLQGPSLEPARFGEIHFRNMEQSLDLAGLMFPAGSAAPSAAAVIIHGSGTSRRDNRWYLSLVHHLQDRGIAVLLPDKRGSVESGGDWRTASMQDLATDTLAAVSWLRARPEVDPKRIGIIGLSQGGWIAPVAASRDADLAFVVSVVGAAVTPAEHPSARACPL